MKTRPLLRATCTAVFFVATASQALAADGFKLRFPLSGTLGGEIVAPMPTEGWIGSIALTDVNVTGVNGNDGNSLKLSNPVPGTPIVGTADVAISNHQKLANLVLVKLLSKDVQGGKLAFAVNIPYLAQFDADLTFTGATPAALNNSPPFPLGAPAAYQAKLADLSKTSDASTSGFGDVEASLLWENSFDNVKVVLGATLAMPTADYKYVPNSFKPNIGFGNYYTLRTGAGVAYKATDSITLGARGSLGFNSQNTDNYVRSGDFYAVDLATAFITPVGVIGPHVTMLRQYTDDSGGSLGANRASTTGAGFFYAVPIEALGGGLNVSYMKTTETKNALTGDFFQLRFSKVF